MKWHRRHNGAIGFQSAVAFFLAATVIQPASALADGMRRVAALHFTAVSCGPCAGAALAMERLKAEAGDSLNVIGVHYYDQYKNPDAESLAVHYSVIGTPTSWFDGVDVQYYADTATYWGYRYSFDKRKVEPPQAVLSLSGWVDTTERVGELTCFLHNLAAETLSAVLRTAVLERAIYRPWGGGDSVYDVLRGMLPGFNGPELLLAPGADTSFSFPFQISPDWNAGQLEFAAWAEKTGDGKAPGAGSIMQSARIGLGQLWGVNADLSPGPVRPTLASAAIYPNPLRDRGTLQLSLINSSWVSINFYDISGRRLKNIEWGWKEPGIYTLDFNPQYLWRNRPPSSVIICQIKLGDYFYTNKIINLK